MPKTYTHEGRQYTHAELETAFEAVEDLDHWKAPIDTMIPKADLAITKAAVIFYTATEVTVDHVGPTHLAISAPGYWAGPAA